jgi:hypothetical protein
MPIVRKTIAAYCNCLNVIIDPVPDDRSSDQEATIPPNNASSSSMKPKQRKARTAFTDYQLQTLEKSFER